MPPRRRPVRLSRRITAALVTAGALAAAAAPAARAQYELPVGISGTPEVAATLTGVEPAGLPPDAEREWRWRRCDGDRCSRIDGATSRTYVVSRDDEGFSLRVSLEVESGGVTYEGTSAPTAVIRSAPVADELPGWTGTARQGERLVGTPGVWWGTEPIALAYQWLRCDDDGEDCTAIDGADELEYTVTAADVGDTLRLRVTATGPAGTTSALSPPTATVVAASAPAPPEGTSFSSTGEAPGETPGSTAAPGEDPAVPPARQGARFIRPFPVVRIAGRFTRGRTWLTLVTIRAPRRARIEIRCRGRNRGCPYTRSAFTSRLMRVRRLQRAFRPGATLEVRITQRGRIGKYTRVRIRAGRPPARVDRCLMPGSRRPVACPSL